MGRSRLRPRRTVSSGSRSAVRHGSEGPSGPLRLSSSVSVSPLLVAGSHRSKGQGFRLAQVALCLLEESLGLVRREGELSNANVSRQRALAAAVRMNEHEGAVPRLIERFACRSFLLTAALRRYEQVGQRLAGILAQTTRVDQDERPDGYRVLCSTQTLRNPGELTVVPHTSPQGKRPSL
jgi:hypothetical protein